MDKPETKKKLKQTDTGSGGKTHDSQRCSTSVSPHDRYNPKYFCCFCEKTFQVKDLLEKHILAHILEKPYNCQACPCEFATREGLRCHWIVKHSLNAKFKCTVCQKVQASKSKHYAHLQRHTNEKPYRCPNCSMTFTTATELRLHSAQHLQDKLFKCNLCEKSFRSAVVLKVHVSRHKGLRIRCSQCARTYISKDGLKRHIKSVHLKLRPFECTVCPKRFASKVQKERHTITHTAEMPYKCGTCEKLFRHKSSLRNHNKRHQKLKSYACTKCTNSYLSELDLMSHYLKDHVGSTDNVLHCLFCEQRFKTLLALEDHTRVHLHERPFFCNSCPLSFRNEAHLKKHVKRVHV